jgi:hypothetical protein
MGILNAFVPDNLTAAITPLITFGGIAIWTNHNFVSGDLTVSGLMGNSSNKYLETGFYPNGFMSANSVHIAAYNVSSGNTSCCIFGSAASIGRIRFGWDASAGYGDYFQAWYDGYDPTGGNNTAYFRGYVCGSKTAADLRTMYWANSITPHYAVSTNTQVDGGGSNTPSNAPAYVFCGNEGFPASFSPKCLSFFSAGTALSSTDSSTLYTLIQTLRMNLGGGYV